MFALAKKLRLVVACRSRNRPPFRGRERLLRATDRFLRTFDRSCIETDIDGVRFRLDTEDLIDFRLAYCGAHQSDLIDYISTRIPNAHFTIWDVGANVGSISLLLAARHSDISIHAFEPSPAIFSRLAANLQRNPKLSSRIDLHQEALSNESGNVRFFASSEPFNSGVGGLGPSLNREEAAVEVAAKCGDDLIESGGLPSPSLIKIDVEGFELEVLQGLERFLRRSRDVEVVFENEPYRLRERAFDKRVVVEHLVKLGFEIRQIAERGTTAPFNEISLDRSCDLVALKPGGGR